MSENQNVTFTATPQEVEQIKRLAEREQREQKQAQQLHARASKIVEVGRKEYGHDRFDGASQAVADALGDRLQQTIGVLSESDTPHRHIVELAEDERRLQEFARLAPERQRAELALRQNRTAPFGYSRASAEPAYLTPAFSGNRMSDADWNSGAADNLSESQWQKQWEARQKERTERRGGRW
jgi:hypothetical protein